MKVKSLLIALLVMAVSSCQKQEDTQPKPTNDTDDRLLGPPIWSTRTANTVELNTRALPGDAVLRPFSYVEPDEIEVYQSTGSMDDFKKIADIPNDGSYKYMVDGLATGVPYFFYIKFKKEGFETTTSKTIMVVPWEVESPIRITNPVGFPIEGATISPGQDQIAYVNTAYTWDNGMYGAPSLFIYDLGTHESRLIQREAVFPDWSPKGNEIVFCTDQNEAAFDGYRPQHLAKYDLETGFITQLTAGQVFDLNPSFSPDGEWIAYISDRAEKNVFDIWKMRPDGFEQTRLSFGLGQATYADNIGMGRPAWSPDGESIYYGVISELPEKDGIFRIDLASNNAEPVVQSQWQDIAPSVSPDGSRMAFLSDRSGLMELWLYHFEQQKYSQLTGVKNGFMEYNWGKIEWLDNQKLMFNAYTDDGTGNNAVYQLTID